jgi:RNA polymerase sigma factor (sigma-70 family)
MSEAEGQSFPDTNWTLVLALTSDPEGTSANAALARLCDIYWRPLYAFARRLGNKPPDAEDLTQSFLEMAVERCLFERAQAGSGRLRNFLLKAFTNHIHNTHREQLAGKRGGEYRFVSWEAIQLFEAQSIGLISSASSPEAIYDKECALAVLDAAMKRLGEEEKVAGRDRLFATVRPYVDATDDNEQSLGELASELGITYAALRQSVYRLRIRFRALIREFVQSTLINPSSDDVADELRSLRRALAD